MSIGSDNKQHFTNAVSSSIDDHILSNTLHKFSYPLTKQKCDEEIMELLHEFNAIKDACQIVLGALANMEQCTIKEMHLKYSLPLKE